MVLVRGSEKAFLKKGPSGWDLKTKWEEAGGVRGGGVEGTAF